MKIFVFVLFFLVGGGYAANLSYDRWTNLAWQASGTTNTSETLREYLQFYHLGWENVTLRSYDVVWQRTNTVFVLVMRPSLLRGVIVFVHGYLDHLGNYGAFYEFFLEKGYAVVAMDLPGHGLSSGLRTGIEDFSDYATALESVLQKVPDIPRRFVAMGFSTGCSVWIEYLHTHRQENRIEKLICVSPLIRLVNWNMALMGYNILGGIITEIPRAQNSTTSDKAFLEFIYNKDPLQEKKIHLSWFRAARNWHERVIQYPSFGNLPVLMVQGREDSVVDWKYNLPVLERLFPRLSLNLYVGNHHLLMETNRQEVYRDILFFLEAL
ncbi:MAG: alpha/beta hydrolase [Brevinematales bacterium]|nr:alpha/beta hydrolase [Brevinematales bacterium]